MKKKVEKQASKVSIEKFNSLLIGEQQYFISYLYDQQKKKKNTFSDSINLLLFLIGTIGDEVKFVSFQIIPENNNKNKNLIEINTNDELQILSTRFFGPIESIQFT